MVEGMRSYMPAKSCIVMGVVWHNDAGMHMGDGCCGIPACMCLYLRGYGQPRQHSPCACFGGRFIILVCHSSLPVHSPHFVVLHFGCTE